MRRFVTVGPAFVVLLTALVTLVAAPAAVRRIAFVETEARVRLAKEALSQDDILERVNSSIRHVAEAVEPSVVHIAVEARRSIGWRRTSQGSGWIFDDQGHVVTNAHVVSGGGRIRVQFFDGRVSTAELVALDPTTDIAVIRVLDREGLFPADRAGPRSLSQGDRVFAFGSPFGFKFSMSEGIVSGLGRDPRDVIRQGGYTNFIQTDAAVNPGNSGGPLIDVNGRVVGMNVAIATGNDTDGALPSEGQSAGISFAIPVVTIESVAQQLIARGVVEKGFLGIKHARSEEENLGHLNSGNVVGRGVYIIEVTPGGPADDAGMLAGDVITSMGGQRVTSVAVLRSRITNHRPGDRIAIDYLRSNKEWSMSVVLGDLAKASVGLERAQTAIDDFGLRLASATDGVLVGEVTSGSLAARAGHSAGDVITEVDNRRIRSIDALFAVVAESGFANGKRLDVTVRSAAGIERMVVWRLID